MRSLHLLLPLSLGFVLPSCGMSFEGRAYAGYMQGELSGQVALDSSAGGVPLGTIQTDIEDDLGITDESDSIYLRGELKMPIAGRLAVSAFRYDQTGSGTLDATFGDIGVGAAVTSDLEFANLKASWTFDLLDFDVVRISPGIGVDIFDIDTTVRSTTPVVAFEEVDVLAPVPMVFLQTEVDLGYVALDVEAGAMDINLEDADGTYWDVDGMLRINPMEHLEFFAGYRFISVDGNGEADGQDFTADLTFQGWFLGGGVTF